MPNFSLKNLPFYFSILLLFLLSLIQSPPLLWGGEYPTAAPEESPSDAFGDFYSRYTNEGVDTCLKNDKVKGFLIYVGSPSCGFCSDFLSREFTHLIHSDSVPSTARITFLKHTPNDDKPYCLWVWEYSEWGSRIQEAQSQFQEQLKNTFFKLKLNKPPGYPYFLFLDKTGQLVDSWPYLRDNNEYFWSFYKATIQKVQDNGLK